MPIPYVISEMIEQGAHFAIMEIIAERQKQVYVHPFTPRHDDTVDQYENQLVAAGKCYIEIALNEMTFRDGDSPPFDWPWSPEEWRPEDSVLENLVKGMTLIAAGYDTIRRGLDV